MSFEFNTYAITLLISGGLVLVFALLVQRPQSGVRWFSGMMVLSAIWAVSYGLELASTTLEAMLFWIRVEYVGISFIPVTWFIFVLRFIGSDGWLTLRNRVLLFGFPCLTLAMVWTNSWHHLHYRQVSMDTSGPFPLLAISEGPWYIVHTIYFYALLGFGLYLLGHRFRHADSLYRRQNLAILVSALIPWIINLIYHLGFKPYRHIDLTPFAFVLTSLVLGFALLRLKLFDLVPMARERVIDGIREGMLVLDVNGRAVDVNATMRGFLGAAGEACIGNDIGRLLPDKSELLLQVRRDCAARLELDLSDGARIRHIDVAVTPLHDERDRRCGTLLIFWDITDLKQAARQLGAQAKELRELNELKTRILSIIAHDLRTPLAGLTGMLEVAESDLLTEQQFREMIPMIARSVGDASGLLDNLLHWSKNQLEGVIIHQQRFDLSVLLREDLGQFGKRAADKGIALNSQVTSESWVYADRNMIELVVRNLISNAIKFSRTGDRITIGTSTDPDGLTLCVADTGVGMPEEVLGRLFGPEITSRLGTQKERGTGLGLKLSRDFVERNGGRVWVESHPGEGSRFYVRLKTLP